MDGFGQQALIHILVYIATLALSWWALHACKIEVIFKNPRSAQAKTFLILLTVGLAYLISQFLLDYLNAATMLRYLFYMFIQSFV